MQCFPDLFPCRSVRIRTRSAAETESVHENSSKLSRWLKLGNRVFLQKKGSCKLCVWEKGEFSWRLIPCSFYSNVFELQLNQQPRDRPAAQPCPQTLRQVHRDMAPCRCTHAPTLTAGLALSPEMMEKPPPEAHCLPQVFITAAAEGKTLRSHYCLFPRDHCLNRAGVQSLQGSPNS